MKARRGSSRSLLSVAAASASASAEEGYPRLLARTRASYVAYSRAAIRLQSRRGARKYIMRVFIQFDVEPRGALQASAQGGQAVDMFILLGEWPPLRQ